MRINKKINDYHNVMMVSNPNDENKQIENIKNVLKSNIKRKSYAQNKTLEDEDHFKRF